jgi:hypothetical protein
MIFACAQRMRETFVGFVSFVVKTYFFQLSQSPINATTAVAKYMIAKL